MHQATNGTNDTKAQKREKPMTEGQHASTLSRRQLIQGVASLLGGTALIGGERLFAYSLEDGVLETAMLQGTGQFTAADIALLDEIADTILPETSTPGAKAAKTGAFIAVMVTDNYTERDRRVFRDGLSKVDAECRAMHGTTFVQATPAQRLSLVEKLDREQKKAMDDRAAAPRSRAPAPPLPDDQPAHYFRMMKELTLLGYFTSEIGYTKAMRYIESPGRFEPCAPHKPGDKTWANHA
jgi:hypothetical protein